MYICQAERISYSYFNKCPVCYFLGEAALFCILLSSFVILLPTINPQGYPIPNPHPPANRVWYAMCMRWSAQVPYLANRSPTYLPVATPLT